MNRQTIDVEELWRLAETRFEEARKKMDLEHVGISPRKLRDAAVCLGEATAWQYLMGWLNDYSGNGKS